MAALDPNSADAHALESASEISARGQAIGLPLIATCADISSARPVTIAGGTPVAALFQFAETERDYWLRGDLALQHAIVNIIRWTAEPFYYDAGKVGSWRPLNMSPDLERMANSRHQSICSSIVCPIHLPGSVVGAVVWATEQADVNVREVFDRHAAELHVLALRFISACNASMHGEPNMRWYRLTRREVQCLKLAAAGKTDDEIATILGLSMPTVRFHLKKAGEKLGESGRLRTVHHAAALGFVSMHL